MKRESVWCLLGRHKWRTSRKQSNANAYRTLCARCGATGTRPMREHELRAFAVRERYADNRKAKVARDKLLADRADLIKDTEKKLQNATLSAQCVELTKDALENNGGEAPDAQNSEG